MPITHPSDRENLVTHLQAALRDLHKAKKVAIDFDLRTDKFDELHEASRLIAHLVRFVDETKGSDGK